MEQEQENNVATSGADQEARKQAKQAKRQKNRNPAELKKKADRIKTIGKYLPAILQVLLIIYIIMVVLGVITLLITMPGTFVENILDFGSKMWASIIGVFNGDNITASVTQKDQLELAQRIQDMGYDIVGYGFADAKYEYDDQANADEIDGFTNGTITSVTPLANSKNYLQAYIAQSEATYVLSTWSFWGRFKELENYASNAIKQIGNWFFGMSNDLVIENDAKAYSEGMLNVDIPEDENTVTVSVDPENKLLKMRILRSGITNIFSKGDLFYFDLSDWTSVYGKPLELSLSLHLATMMPDLSYEFATADCFNTKVNIDLQKVQSTFKVILKNPDGSEIQQDDIIKTYLQYVCNISEEIINKFVEAGKLNEFFQAVMEKVENVRVDLINLVSGGSYYPSANGVETHSDINLTKLEQDILGTQEGEETYKLHDVNVIREEETTNDEGESEIVETTNVEDMDQYVSVTNLENDAEKAQAGVALTSTGLSNFTIDQVIDIAKLMLDGVRPADTYLPRISSVTKHWFYNDIIFDYGTAGKAKKKIQYVVEDEDDPLSETNLNGATIVLDTTYTSASGVLYQLAEPEATGPNDAIIALFKGGSGTFDGVGYNFPGEYYRYDGTRDTALKIANAKAKDAGDSEFTFQGETHITDTSEDSVLNITKQPVTFATKDEDGNETFNDAYTAFSILENVHTLESETVYRLLKELLIELEYFTKEDFQKPLKQVLLWPVERVGSDTEEYDSNADEVTNGIYRDDLQYGLFLKNGVAVNAGDTLIAPGDATVVKVDGNSVTLKFKSISEGQAKALETKFGEDYSSVDKDIVLDMEMTIQGLTPHVSVGQNVNVGSTIGVATSEDTRILMYNIDKSYVENIETYMYPTYEGTRQIIVLPEDV